MFSLNLYSQPGGRINMPSGQPGYSNLDAARGRSMVNDKGLFDKYWYSCKQYARDCWGGNKCRTPISAATECGVKCGGVFTLQKHGKC